MSTQYILYGAGELGKLARNFFNDIKVPYKYVVDIEPSNYFQNSFWKNDKITKLEDVSDEDKQNCVFVICISTYSYNEIKNNLMLNGCKVVKSLFEVSNELNTCNHPLTNGWSNSKLCEDTNRLKEVDDHFKDSISHDHYFQFLLWHVNYTEMLFPNSPINCNDRYFIPEIRNILTEEEVFVDCGAYDGRVSLQFKHIVNSKYKSIHCFEPDDDNYISLLHNTSGLNNWHKFPVVLGNDNEFIDFKQGYGFLSKVGIDSTSKGMATRKLDYMCLLNDIEPTFIKYHLEGYELEAIKGSLKTITKYRPIVVTTVYHTEEGAYELPIYCMNNFKDYGFLFRNHNYMGTGAVLYCIPKERF